LQERVYGPNLSRRQLVVSDATGGNKAVINKAYRGDMSRAQQALRVSHCCSHERFTTFSYLLKLEVDR
jgi:hypothetical protein